MAKTKQKKGSSIDKSICKLVVQDLKREIRKEKCKQPASFHASTRVYKKRDPPDPSVNKKSRKVFTGIEVPNWTTDSPLFNVGTDDYPASFESIESSTVLESILRDVQEEHHFTNRDMENEELLRKEKITVNKQHAKRMAQISIYLLDLQERD
ncbi:Uncharacterized protein APZ42_033058 [Daphnia magna]|uniref:Uncharacterized protein n=1 Tax=Daphnia magna TaxID=35525 RepID=A0A162D8B2_9CRUS|nr:Uncharacterized protein APZ42_033058 [Daphnia magna]